VVFFINADGVPYQDAEQKLSRRSIRRIMDQPSRRIIGRPTYERESFNSDQREGFGCGSVGCAAQTLFLAAVLRSRLTLNKRHPLAFVAPLVPHPWCSAPNPA